MSKKMLHHFGLACSLDMTCKMKIHPRFRDSVKVFAWQSSLGNDKRLSWLLYLKPNHKSFSSCFEVMMLFASCLCLYMKKQEFVSFYNLFFDRQLCDLSAARHLNSVKASLWSHNHPAGWSVCAIDRLVLLSCWELVSQNAALLFWLQKSVRPHITHSFPLEWQFGLPD